MPLYRPVTATCISEMVKKALKKVEKSFHQSPSLRGRLELYYGSHTTVCLH